MLLLPLHMGIKARAERFLCGHLNLLDINCYLRSRHLKRCHCRLPQPQQRAEATDIRGKDNHFFLPKLNSDTQVVTAKIHPQLHMAVAVLTGKQEELSWAGWRPDTGPWGEESHRPPSRDRLPGGCLGAWPTLLGRGERVQNRLVIATAVKGLPALATENRVKKPLSP